MSNMDLRVVLLLNSLCLEILRIDSHVWTAQKYWKLPCEKSVQSNFSGGQKFDRHCPWKALVCKTKQPYISNLKSQISNLYFNTAKLHQGFLVQCKGAVISRWGGGEGWEGRNYFKSESPKLLAPLRLTAQNPAPSKSMFPKNCNPLLMTFWVFECCIARIHISVTLRQLFHWNKKNVTIYNIFGGRSGIIWILMFMIPVVFYLNDPWFSSRFMIHKDFWSPIHLMMFSLAT